jgi:hypothetical protein
MGHGNGLRQRFRPPGTSEIAARLTGLRPSGGAAFSFLAIAKETDGHIHLLVLGGAETSGARVYLQPICHAQKSTENKRKYLQPTQR